jgi:hypothetical protein
MVSNLGAGIAVEGKAGQGVVDHAGDGVAGAFLGGAHQRLYRCGIGHIGLQRHCARTQFFGQRCGLSLRW